MRYTYTYQLSPQATSDHFCNDKILKISDMHWLSKAEQERVTEVTGIEWGDDGETIVAEWELE